MIDMGRITVTVETAEPQPYGSAAYPYGNLSAFVTGPTRLARLFELALSRSQRRKAERARADAPRRWRRPRLHDYDVRLTDDSPAPKGWHLKGDCPECSI